MGRGGKIRHYSIYWRDSEGVSQDRTNYRLLTTITDPNWANPQSVAVSPTGANAGDVYVTNVGNGTVSVINPATNTVIATITVSNGPTGVAVGDSF